MVFKLFGEAQELLDTNTLNQRSWNMFFFSLLTAENWTSSHWKLAGTRDRRAWPLCIPSVSLVKQTPSSTREKQVTGYWPGLRKESKTSCSYHAEPHEANVSSGTPLKNRLVGSHLTKCLGRFVSWIAESHVFPVYLSVSLLFIKRQLGVIKTGF